MNNSKKIDLLLRSRRQRAKASNSNEIDQFSKFFDTMIFMEEFYRQKFTDELAEIEKKEKAAKEKGQSEGGNGVFGKKFTFGQMVFWTWAGSLPLSLFWLLLLYRVF